MTAKATYRFKVLVEQKGPLDLERGGFRWTLSKNHFPSDVIVQGKNYADAEARALSLLPTLDADYRYDFSPLEVVLLSEED